MYDGINNVCPVCGGRGYVRQQCDKCGGDGQVDKECSCRQW